MARQKDCRGVGDRLQPLVSHGEQSQFIDCAEAVFHGADETELAVGFAFKIEHGIHRVLEHTRSGKSAILGNVADKDHRGACVFGETHQQCC